MIRAHLFAAVFGVLIIVPKGHAEMTPRQAATVSQRQTHSYIGLWVTADGHIRHNLLPNGRSYGGAPMETGASDLPPAGGAEAPSIVSLCREPGPPGRFILFG